MKSLLSVVLVCLASVATVGCAPTDPRLKLLKERARWNVELLGFSSDPESGITISTRISGPVRSSLKQLSCRISMYDEQGVLISEEWHVLELDGIKRGTPTDYLLKLEPRARDVDRMSLDVVHNPAPEDEPHIVELAAVSSS